MKAKRCRFSRKLQSAKSIVTSWRYQYGAPIGGLLKRRLKGRLKAKEMDYWEDAGVVGVACSIFHLATLTVARTRHLIGDVSRT